jgi:hypothetical protein
MKFKNTENNADHTSMTETPLGLAWYIRFLGTAGYSVIRQMLLELPEAR